MILVAAATSVVVVDDVVVVVIVERVEQSCQPKLEKSTARNDFRHGSRAGFQAAPD